jgi:septin family protein
VSALFEMEQTQTNKQPKASVLFHFCVHNMSSFDYTFKLLVVGESGVGKSLLVKTFVQRERVNATETAPCTPSKLVIIAISQCHVKCVWYKHTPLSTKILLAEMSYFHSGICVINCVIVVIAIYFALCIS